MRVIIRPSLAPKLHLDVTRALTAAIAQELARVQEGNDVLNWLEAERIIADLFSGNPHPTAGPVDESRLVEMDEVTPRGPRIRQSGRRAVSALPGPGDVHDNPAPMSPTRG